MNQIKTIKKRKENFSDEHGIYQDEINTKGGRLLKTLHIIRISPFLPAAGSNRSTKYPVLLYS